MMKKIDFETALMKLESEVKRLESGNMSLDESIATFEEAVKLVKICNERLEFAQRRVRILTEGEDGTVTDASFDECDET
jgi:exodeoxyribonuclease VII small subunit